MTRLRAVAALAVLLGSGLSTSCRDKAAEDQQQKVHRQAQAAIALASRHSAIRDWDRAFEDGRVLPFSITLEEALVRQDGRPALLAPVQVDDVQRQGDRYYIEVVLGDSLELLRLRFLLECPKETALSLVHREDASPLVDDFAVVAQVDSVQKFFGLRPMKQGRGEPTLEADPVFVASGKCLEIVRLK